MISHNILRILVLASLIMVGCKKNNTNLEESVIQLPTNSAIIHGPIRLDLDWVGYDRVTFTAKINVDLMAKYQEVGFLYSTNDDLKVDKASVKVISIKEETYEDTFEISGDTEYYYTTYTLKYGIYSYGETKCFKSLRTPYTIQSNLNIVTATDLSSPTSANCYIVSEPGLYKFKAVKGNSCEVVGSVASASIIWETFGTLTIPDYLELIGGVCYKDGYIVFNTSATFKEGNAVIAAMDANSNILWSWHIWLTDQPQEQVYNNNAGTLMDRNLGATSATPGDLGALGLLYQWGRKDPFLGASSISSSTPAKSTIAWPSAVSTSSSIGTIEYITSHPTTFVTAPSLPYDWHYASRDNTLWTTNDKTKSIYDPCPAGWRVPDGDSNGVWSKALASPDVYIDNYDSINKGMNFFGKFGSDQFIWYPASGYRYNSGVGLSLVGHNSRHWSASPYGNDACGLSFSSSGSVAPLYGYNRACGYSVRCFKE